MANILRCLQFPTEENANSDDESPPSALEEDEVRNNSGPRSPHTVSSNTSDRIMAIVRATLENGVNFGNGQASQAHPRRVELNGEDDDDTSSEEGYEECCAQSDDDDDKLSMKSVCIVCDRVMYGRNSAEKMKTHIEEEHDFSFALLKEEFNPDSYSYIKFIRWAREQKYHGRIEKSLKDIFIVTVKKDGKILPLWYNDRFLSQDGCDGQEKDDYLLTLGYFLSGDPEPEQVTVRTPSPANVEELLREIEQLKQDKLQMQDVCKRLIDDNSMSKPRSPTSPYNRPSEGTHVHSGLPARSTRRRSPSPPNTQMTRSNAAYFESYDDVGIHHEMVFDLARTVAYKDAISDKSVDIKGKVVMDVGCGTGILSMFCAREGAQRVYAVENSNIFLMAIQNIMENEMSDLIKVSQRDVEKDMIPELGNGKVDILISEFMGYFLFFEGMTETFIRARNRFLKPGGILMPDQCEVFVVPLGPTGIYKKRMTCWDDVFGFNMSCMKSLRAKEVLIDRIDEKDIIGKAVSLTNLDLYTCQPKDVYVDRVFEFEINQNTELCAIGGYFNVAFTPRNSIGNAKTRILSTSPESRTTHWKQAVFFLPQKISVKRGDKIAASFVSHANPENPRELLVSVKVGTVEMTYVFN